MGMNEMNVVGNPITMLKAPRNMFAFQAGFVVPIPVGNFSSLTVQWTYIGPFVYTHYPIMEKTGVLADLSPGITTITDFENTYTIEGEEGRTILYKNKNTSGVSDWELDVSDSPSKLTSPDGRTVIEEADGLYHIYETSSETAYVNKGENLGYPLDPNSQEFLVQLDLGLPKGWTAQLQTKYQVRSGQYGFMIEQYMNYSDDDNYQEKNFWDNEFKRTLSMQMKTSKKFSEMPIELTAGYRFTVVWEKPVTSGDIPYDGRGVTFGPWNDPTFDHIVQIGAKVFF
jgi:hypothetical protein